MNAPRAARWAFPLLAFLAFPHPVAGTVLDLGIALGWLVPGCLILALEGRAPRAGARVGFLAAWLAHCLIFHWIYVVTVHYGHAPVVVGVLAPIVLALYPALFGAAFGAGWCALARRGWATPLAAAALWTVVEHAKTWLLTGFPWALLGYSQHQNEALLGLAPWVGVHGMGFALAWGSAALARGLALRRAGLGPDRAVWAGLAAVVLLHAAGLALRTPEAAAGPRVRVAALQGNIDQGVKWNPAWVEQTMRHYEELTRRAAAEGADLILWPETAVPGALELEPALSERIAALSEETGATLVVGGVGAELDAERRRIARFYDSAFVVEPERGYRHRYDKTHLVPFGEYVPLRGLLGQVLGAVARGIASGDVTPGPRPVAHDLDLRGREQPVRAGIPICYELLFPDLVRRFVSDGGGMLLAITNDAWYGRTGAPYQFLAITSLRSAETGVWTIRAANTGVSAIIDARGRVREQTPIFERSHLVADVPLRVSRGTFYVRNGDLLVWACWLGLGALAVRARRAGAPEVAPVVEGQGAA